MTLQLQFNAYNALNHALRAAVGDTPDGSVTSNVGFYNTQAPGQPQAFLSNLYGNSNQRFIIQHISLPQASRHIIGRKPHRAKIVRPAGVRAYLDQ